MRQKGARFLSSTSQLFVLLLVGVSVVVFVFLHRRHHTSGRPPDVRKGAPRRRTPKQHAPTGDARVVTGPEVDDDRLTRDDLTKNHVEGVEPAGSDDHRTHTLNQGNAPSERPRPENLGGNTDRRLGPVARPTARVGSSSGTSQATPATDVTEVPVEQTPTAAAEVPVDSDQQSLSDEQGGPPREPEGGPTNDCPEGRPLGTSRQVEEEGDRSPKAADHSIDDSELIDTARDTATDSAEVAVERTPTERVAEASGVGRHEQSPDDEQGGRPFEPQGEEKDGRSRQPKGTEDTIDDLELTDAADDTASDSPDPRVDQTPAGPPPAADACNQTPAGEEVQQEARFRERVAESNHDTSDTTVASERQRGNRRPSHPSRYDGLTRQPPRPSSSNRSQTRTLRTTEVGRPLPIEVRLRFERGGSCVVSLVPRRSRGTPEDVIVATASGSFGLLAMQDDWYQDVISDDIGRILREGTVWGQEGGAARWSLSGRDLYVLGEHSELSGWVSQPSLKLGRQHVILCAEEILSTIEEELGETGVEHSTSDTRT